LTGDVAIIGGSLAGLATGIGLARRGILVNVFEQNTGEERGGTGLGVDRALIAETTDGLGVHESARVDLISSDDQPIRGYRCVCRPSSSSSV
jgi:2-polyprenyl-6-methoxyphenol hydroxylase-like FAD-dependent oxidoreductase